MKVREAIKMIQKDGWFLVATRGSHRMSKYLVIVEETETGYSAFSPDLTGCVTTGKTREEVEQTMQEAIQFHLDGLKEDGDLTPTPHSYSTYCEVPA